MAVLNVASGRSIDQFRQVCNQAFTNIGDLLILDTTDKSSAVAAINELNSRVDSLIISNSLVNNEWLQSTDFIGTGFINILKVNEDDNTEFDADVVDINITGGTITGITDLAIADGGTGGSDVATAQQNLEVEVGVDVQAYDAGLADIAALAPTLNNMVVGDDTNWVLATPSDVRTALSLVVGTNVQAYAAGLTDIGNLTPTYNNFVIGNATSDHWIKATPGEARTALSLVIGYDGSPGNVQQYNAYLSKIATLTPTLNNVLLGDGSNWTLANYSTMQSVLQLVPGTTIQAYDLNLTQIANLTPTKDSFIRGNTAGTAWESVAGARLSEIAALGVTTNRPVIGNGTNLVLGGSALAALAYKASVAAGDIDSNAVTTVKILNSNVTNAKLAAGTYSNITGLDSIGVIRNSANDLTVFTDSTGGSATGFALDHINGIITFYSKYDGASALEFVRSGSPAQGYLRPNTTARVDLGQSTRHFRNAYVDNYTPFSGSHIFDNPGNLEIGDAVALVDGKLKKLTYAESAACIGIFSEIESETGKAIISAVGELKADGKCQWAQIGSGKGFKVNDEGGPIVSGTLLTASNKPGWLCAQSDNIVRSTTVGKCLENIMFDDHKAVNVYGVVYCG